MIRLLDFLKKPQGGWAAESILLGFTFFNSVLCILLGFGFDISSSHVIAVQMLLTVWMVALMMSRQMVKRFDIIFLSILVGAVIYVYVMREASVRSFFDVLIVPLAFLFGLRSRVNVWLVIRVVYWAVLVFGLIEFFLPDLFVKVLPVGKYYFSTRGWVADQDIDLDLAQFYVGAERGGGGIFLSSHRHASIFLDPLTLGYFSTLIVAAARLYASSIKTFLAYSLGAAMLALLSDSRIALLLVFLFMLLPRHSAVLLTPFIVYWLGIFMIALMIWVFGSQGMGEIYERLSYTFSGLLDNPVISFFVGGDIEGKFNDSGYLYLLNTLGAPLALLSLLYIDAYRLRLQKNEWAIGCLFFLFYLSITLFFGQATLSAKVVVLWAAFAGVTLAKSNDASREAT